MTTRNGCNTSNVCNRFALLFTLSDGQRKNIESKGINNKRETVTLVTNVTRLLSMLGVLHSILSNKFGEV